MNPKTITRLGVKLLAGFLIIRILTDFLPMPISLAIQAMATATPPSVESRAFIVFLVIHAIVPIGVGIYLMFGGRWLINRIMPADRSCCRGCGYVLSDPTGDSCPGCDTGLAWN